MALHSWIRALKTVTAGLFFVALTGLMGCYGADSGFRNSWGSEDRYEFESRVELPTTIALVETHSGRVIWQRDIPVEGVAIVDLDRMDEVEWMRVSGRPAHRMTWRIYAADRSTPLETGEIKLPGTPVMLKPTYRVGPELPKDYVAPVDVSQEKETVEVPATTSPAASSPASETVPATLPAVSVTVPAETHSTNTPAASTPAITTPAATQPGAETAVPVHAH